MNALKVIAGFDKEKDTILSIQTISLLMLSLWTETELCPYDFTKKFARNAVKFRFSYAVLHIG